MKRELGIESNGKEYKIYKIYEADFGCEERPDGSPLMVDVILIDADGEEVVWKTEDATLTQYKLDEGDEILFDPDMKVFLRKHRL